MDNGLRNAAQYAWHNTNKAKREASERQRIARLAQAVEVETLRPIPALEAGLITEAELIAYIEWSGLRVQPRRTLQWRVTTS